MIKSRSILACAIAAIGTSGASAAVIPPGAVADNFFTSLAESPAFGGTVIASQTIPLALRGSDGSVVTSISVLNQVIRDGSGNTLSFAYRILNGRERILGVDRVDAHSFAGYSTDVASLIDGGGESAPSIALRSGAADGVARITFDFDDAASRISPDASSFSFLVKSNATTFDSSGSISLSAFTAASMDTGSDRIASADAVASTFEPAARGITIPLPAPVLMSIPTAVLAMYCLRRARRAGLR